MKKLFYIILVVAVLFVLGKFVKEKQLETPVVESVTITEEEGISPDTVVVPEAAEEVVETIQYNDDADGMVIDESDTQFSDDIVEENPEFTSDDDETIVAE
ncbi:MAG: hypothetical protein PHE89_08100 [Alphaproteobacteria bacterium]|nr:hypothetical protein [Alphaproteobacteria bacterium]